MILAFLTRISENHVYHLLYEVKDVLYDCFEKKFFIDIIENWKNYEIYNKKQNKETKK